MREVKARKRRPRASYHHGDLRNALLAGVRNIVRERGIGGVSLREVARRAKVSHAAPAHHFRNKAALLTAFAGQGYLLLAEEVVAEITASEAEDPATTLEAIGRGYVSFALRNPEHFGMMFRVDALDAGDPDFQAAADSAYSVLSSTVEDAAREGLLPGRDPAEVAVAAWSMVHGFASLWIDGRLADRVAERDPGKLAAAISRLFVDAVMRPGR